MAPFRRRALRAPVPSDEPGIEKVVVMKNRWSDKDARAAVARYRKQGAGRDLALRLYTTRLLGREPALVRHGGGNTSVKTPMADAAGTTSDVLLIKGSGHDMATIEARGMPALRLDHNDQLQDSIKHMFESEGPQLLHVLITETQNVYPIVPPGQAPQNMVNKAAEISS